MSILITPAPRVRARALPLPVLYAVAVLAAAAFTALALFNAHERAAEAAAREHAAMVARVQVMVEAQAADEAFLKAQAVKVRKAQIAAIQAHFAQLRAQIAERTQFAQALLASSDGKADPALRANLQASVDQLAATGLGQSQVAAAVTVVNAAADQVTASVTAWEAEQARQAEAARQAAAAQAARAATHKSTSSAKATGRTSAAATVPAPGGGSIIEVGEATLRSLPGNGGVSLSWDDPGLSGHLGGVWQGSTSTILINGSKLAGNPGKTRDVVRHEIAHIYQGRLMASTGLSWAEIDSRMSGAFGANASEKAADCVAKRFGASWTHYTSSCSGADKQAWVDALIGGYLP